MKTSEIKLTKTAIDAAKPNGERYAIWDSELKGFGIRIASSGLKTFVVKYLAQGGGRRAPQRYLSLGRYGALTVEQARRRAKEVIGAAANGQDRVAERNNKRKELNVGELIDLYEEEGCYIQRGKHQGVAMKLSSAGSADTLG